MDSIDIRPAAAKDLTAILDIYNEIIANSTAVYSIEASTLAERTRWFEGRMAAGYPVLVADVDGSVAGFSSFGEFRGAWNGYRYAAEHTVHVHCRRRGQGIGPKLVAALFPYAAAMNKHLLIGGVDAANAGSIRMHERLGFEQVAHFREVGRKFGRWLDLVFLQRFIDPAGAPRAD